MTVPGDRLERDWARLGVLFNCPQARRTPDLERLFLETARRCTTNARLLPLIVTWTAAYGHFIARHRLARLVRTELEQQWRPVLGLLVEESVAHGAPRGLLVAAQHCGPASPARPLSDAFDREASLRRVAERNASATSRKWGVWTPELIRKSDALRPASWILSRNPSLHDRALRKGDLRVSILETLRRDLPQGRAPSESALARLCGATRLATHRALAALNRENAVTLADVGAGKRDRAVWLSQAA